MSNTIGSNKAFGLRKADRTTKTIRIVNRSAMAGKTAARSPLTRRFVPRYTPSRGRLGRVDPAAGAPRSIEQWEKEVKNVVSSFEIAAQDIQGRIEVNFEVTFDLRETGLTLEWLSEVFRNYLAAVEVPEARDVMMKADFDTVNTDQVTIQLLSAVRRRDRNPLGHERTPPHNDTVEHFAADDERGRRADADERRWPNAVELETATGKLTYDLPLSLSRDTLSSMEVSEILSPSSKPNRALANNRRKANQILGLQVGNQYRYPRFQFDLERKRIHPLAEYANRAMKCDLDPWGTLDWWFTDNTLIDGEQPADRLAHGHLSEKDIDLMVEAEQLGMD